MRVNPSKVAHEDHLRVSANNSITNNLGNNSTQNNLGGTFNGAVNINTHFHGKQSLQADEVAQRLWEGAHKVYKKIRTKGRFSGVRIKPRLFAKVKVQVSKQLSQQDRLIQKEKINQLEKGRDTPFALDETILNDCWSNGFPHNLLEGEDGMGKTTSLLKIWDDYLRRTNKKIESDNTEEKEWKDFLYLSQKKESEQEWNSVPYNQQTIPLYIPLSQYNHLPRIIQEKFLTHYITVTYLGIKVLEDDVETAFSNWLEQEQTENEAPKIILLLDGLNEITADISPLLKDLNNWVGFAKTSGIQIIISSRYRSKHQFSDQFNALTLQPLDKDAINSFLGKEKSIDIDENLKSLLATAMMLNLYEKLLEDGQTTEVQCAGELLWNFIELKLKRLESAENDKVNKARKDFLIQYLIPFVAYQMERNQIQKIHEKEIERVISQAFKRFYEPDFFIHSGFHRKDIKKYRKYIQALQIGTLPLLEEIGRFERLMEEFKQELFPISREDEHLQFYHQSFQDFFAAKHILNEVNLALEKKSLPDILQQQPLSENLQKMLGEILKEHKNQPKLMPVGSSWGRYYQKTSLGHLLDLCKGQMNLDDLGYTVWNILTIWAKVRGTLAGSDLSNLNLSGFDFNGIDCLEILDNKDDIVTNWDNSHFSPKQWFPQGHAKEVTKIRVSPNGQYLATASKDGTIKLWLVSTNEYIRTFHKTEGHLGEITTIAFSPDSTRLSSSSDKGKIIEWSVSTGHWLNVFRGHSATIRAVDYHQNGEKLISASEDGTVREWSTTTGLNIFVYDLKGTEETWPIHTVAYIRGGNAILVGSEQGNIKIYSIGTAKSREIFEQKNVLAIAINNAQDKIAAISIESIEQDTKPNIPTIKAAAEKKEQIGTVRILEWSLKTRDITQSFKLDKNHKLNLKTQFMDITYSPNDKQLLVAGIDDYIYEWDAKEVKDNGDLEESKVSQIFKGHPRKAISIDYHPTGKHFYSSSNDGTSKKWSTSNGQILHHTFSCQSSPYNSIIKIPNFNRVFACSENGAIHRWVIVDNKPKRDLIFKGEAPAYSIQYYKKKCGTSCIIAGEESGIIQVWTLDGICLRKFIGHKETVTTLAIHQATGLVASADLEGNLLLWSLEDETYLIPYPEQESSDPITSIVFSLLPEERRFVASYKSGLIKLLSGDLTQLPLVNQEFDHGSRVYSIDFDGRYILSGGFNGTIKEWDIFSKEATFSLELKEEKIISISYSPNEERILVGTLGGNNLLELPIKTGAISRGIDIEKIIVFEGHEDYLISAVYDDCMSTIFSVSQDATLRQWDRKTGLELWSIKNIPGLKVAGLNFSKVRWTEPLTDEQYELLHRYHAVQCSYPSNKAAIQSSYDDSVVPSEAIDHSKIKFLALEKIGNYQENIPEKASLGITHTSNDAFALGNYINRMMKSIYK